jgi:glyoxylase-like metal-dependent hydrolase (beta-lactamase superfamily II)
MSEPKTVAQSIEEIVPGVWRWSVHDDRIDYESDAYAVVENARVVLIDPLPLDETALRRLGTIEAICLTAKCHQRSTWRYRQQFSVKVYAPEGVRPMEEEPDVVYREGDHLPGGLQAIRTPGPEYVHFAFLLAREPGVLFCPDLLMHGKGKLDFVPAEFHEDPAATRESVRRLLALRFSVLCFNHGAPIVHDPHAALREVLKLAVEQAEGKKS